MVYGGGYPLADDVVGHELTHGVTAHTSNLFYFYQSGAINIPVRCMGRIIDQTNNSGDDFTAVKWKMGENVLGGAIRVMKNPPAFSLTRVNDAGFVNGASTLRWKGSNRTTTVLSPTQLVAAGGIQ